MNQVIGKVEKMGGLSFQFRDKMGHPRCRGAGGNKAEIH
jgi:hypothetical protein